VSGNGIALNVGTPYIIAQNDIEIERMIANPYVDPAEKCRIHRNKNFQNIGLANPDQIIPKHGANKVKKLIGNGIAPIVAMCYIIRLKGI
jgi:hypothetical protein